MNDMRLILYERCRQHYWLGNYPEKLEEEIVNKILNNNLTINQFYDLLKNVIDRVEETAHISH